MAGTGCSVTANNEHMRALGGSRVMGYMTLTSIVQRLAGRGEEL